MTTTKILAIDDHTILLDGVVELLKKSEKYEVLETAASAESGLEKLKILGDQVQVLITDISLPGIKGPELARAIKARFPSIKIIALSMHEEKHIINDMLRAGVDGYVLKKATHEELIGALDAVMIGESYVSPAITKMLIDNVRNPPLVDLLSDREKEIIRLIVQELTTKKIAEALFISEKTVEAHKTNIFRKTRTSTLVGLTKFAIKHQIA
ncbi:MAG: response regulator transcription factor [Cyclobacteriaceae bacterium]